ncbi:Fic family protein [Trueperella pyogenes]|uniref:Fic family protein n=1 Tax=Trueperella pyogenes TaxID=1661 RepID=UPI00345D8F4E
MTVVRQASNKLAHVDEVTVTDLVDLQAALLGSEAPTAGIRTVHNWIGVSNFHPIGADYVPPTPELVEGLIEDLLAYLNGATHGSLIQAALVHAQFESIHPFTDGNGRVGRALIHTVLTRRGLTPSRVQPVSLVLSIFRDSYVAALNALRFEGAASMPENAQAVNEWNERLESYRDSLGYTRKVRSDSAVSQILPRLAGSPVLTIKTASEIHGLSPQKAHEALTQLRGAGIMTTKTIARGRHAYIAHEVLNLITFAERALASTRFDTRVNPPNRQVPARPAGA